ncbi:MAG: L-serine ammonia-lyase, iron-sulfur-dependent subunit beta [Oscillospiraceae bacterium]|jgi:L-serine dehydratase|nr:L-serine ammonia-lyase, iron-sulfur-dependent subunit beta [Oscillospiraceae bacterium]
MDIFEIIGPIMVGPSSSHTAGAVRIGLVARKLLARPPIRAELLLHGSFAATGRGHGTDRALVAGLLGFEPDDTRIPDSFAYAKEAGLDFHFDTVQLRDAHPNSVLLRLWAEPDGKPMEVVGASIGGGRIEIREFNGIKLRFSAEAPTLIVKNRDNPGSVADVSYLISRRNINIATFQVNRSSRGGEAVMVIECDTPIRQELITAIRSMPDIVDAVGINP